MYFPNMPNRIKRLPLDRRGFPVPYFVQWLKDGEPVRPGVGAPDFRIMDREAMRRSIQHKLCTICGEPLGGRMVFAIGPMCVVSRVSGEPPCHRECAEFAARHCPFLSNPRMRRNDKDIPEHVGLGGVMIERNPGVTCLWVTRSYKLFRPSHGAEGVLFRLGPCEEAEWYAWGREATRAEVIASIDSGMPALREIAEKQGVGKSETDQDVATALQLVTKTTREGRPHDDSRC